MKNSLKILIAFFTKIFIKFTNFLYAIYRDYSLAFTDYFYEGFLPSSRGKTIVREIIKIITYFDPNSSLTFYDIRDSLAFKYITFFLMFFGPTIVGLIIYTFIKILPEFFQIINKLNSLLYFDVPQFDLVELNKSKVPEFDLVESNKPDVSNKSKEIMPFNYGTLLFTSIIILVYLFR